MLFDDVSIFLEVLMKRIAVGLLTSWILAVAAQAQMPSPANLLQDWVCGPGTCDTKCTGPGGTFTVTARDVKVFQFTVHPRRIWLNADGHIYVLGDDDRCEFGGATSTAITFPTPPVQTVPLPPVPPQCTCIGGVCTPPGCSH
jgi:hypothetical protein